MWEWLRIIKKLNKNNPNQYNSTDKIPNTIIVPKNKQIIYNFKITLKLGFKIFFFTNII